MARSPKRFRAPLAGGSDHIAEGTPAWLETDRVPMEKKAFNGDHMGEAGLNRQIEIARHMAGRVKR